MPIPCQILRNMSNYHQNSSKGLSLSLYSHPTNPKISALQKVEQLDMYKGGCGDFEERTKFMIQPYYFGTLNRPTHLVFLVVKPKCQGQKWLAKNVKISNFIYLLLFSSQIIITSLQKYFSTLTFLSDIWFQFGPNLVVKILQAFVTRICDKNSTISVFLLIAI